MKEAFKSRNTWQRKANEKQKQDWMKKFEKEAYKLGIPHGKIGKEGWDTANYLFNMRKSPDQAAKDLKDVWKESVMTESDLRSMIQDIIRELLNDDELQETSTTGNVAGYNTPGAFVGKQGRKRKRDWVAKTTSQLGYEVIGDEEEADDMEEEKKQSNLLFKNGIAEQTQTNKQHYMSVTGRPTFMGTKENKDDKERWLEDLCKEIGWELLHHISNPTDPLVKVEKKENPKMYVINTFLHEGRRGRYQEFRDDPRTNKQKIGTSLRSVRDQLAEIERVIDENLRLKQETDTQPKDYWKNTHRALYRITEKMHRIINKIRRF